MCEENGRGSGIGTDRKGQVGWNQQNAVSRSVKPLLHLLKAGMTSIFLVFVSFLTCLPPDFIPSVISVF